MIVVIHFVLFFASSWSTLGLPPHPMTTEPPTACTCEDGTKLPVGGQHLMDDCNICYCDEEYGVQWILGDCLLYTECVDPLDIKGDGICCPSCPNGRNCGVDYDKYGVSGPIPDGKVIHFGNVTCSCKVDMISYDHYPWYDSLFPIADCVFPPNCTCSDNTTIPIGHSHRINDCLTCKCDEKTGEQYVEEECSTKVACADYRAVDGDGICCPSCPNGKNCKAEVGSNTTIIPDGQTIVFCGGKCTCDVSNQANSTSFYPKAICENV